MAKKKIRLGLIGCGSIARGAHLPRIQADGHVVVVAASDPAEHQVAAFMERWGREVAYYADDREMLRREALDAILISSPHSLHYEHAHRALQDGLHVLVEKPMTPSSRRNGALLALARKKKRVLMVSYQRHFLASYLYVRELIQKGLLGDLRSVVAYITQDWQRVGGWRLDPRHSGGGMFMDTGSHLVAAVLWMTQLIPVEVSAFVDQLKEGIDINTVLSVRFEGGSLGTLSTLGNAALHDEHVAIHGSRGGILFRQHQWEQRSVLLDDKPLDLPARIKETTPDAAFFRFIRNGGKGYTPPDFTVWVAALSEAAYRSASSKQSVKIRA